MAAFSQAPEFAQQYRQRLGGAVAELEVVVEDFDRDAQNSGLNRAKALETLIKSAEQLPRDRGASMTRTIARYENISSQQEAMELGEPLTRPIFLFNTPDRKLLGDTWEIFEPAIPVTLPGLIWGGFGAFLAGFLARIPIGLGGRLRRKLKSGKSGVHIEPQLSAETAATIEPGEIHLAPGLQGADQSQNRTSLLEGLPPEQKPNRSLLDQVRMRERMLGEVGPDGRISRPRKGLL
jgi:hypothetical protein